MRSPISYESTRADHDNAPVAPVPEKWIALASRIAGEAGFAFAPDLCIMNCMTRTDEWACTRTRTKAASRSKRDCRSCRCHSAIRRGFSSAASSGAIRSNLLLLESGDAFVFGGAARLRYHGVSRIVPGTAPAELGIDGRFNLTFRKVSEA